MAWDGGYLPMKVCGTSIAALSGVMAQDLEQTLKEIFGDSMAKLSQFQADKMKRLTTKLNELARDAVKDELSKLHSEIADLRARVAKLETERAQVAAESVESSF